MNCKKLIYDLQGTRGAWIQSDENPLSDFQLLYQVDAYRALLISQRTLRSYDEDLDQTLFAELSDVPQYSNPHLLCKATGVLPNMIRRGYVGGDDGMNPFSQLSLARLSSIKERKHFTARYNLKDNRLYVFYPPTRQLTHIMVKGVFSHPLEVEEYNRKTTVDDLNFNYPMPTEWVDTVRKLLIQTEFHQVLQDKRNDSSDGLSVDAQGMPPSGK